MNATRDVRQEFTFVTFDIAVAKKKKTLITSQKYTKTLSFILAGAFHSTMSYLSDIGKVMKGSGFEEIVI